MYEGQIYQIVRILELTEETGTPTEEWFLPLDSEDYTQVSPAISSPKRVNKTWLIREIIAACIKVEKNLTADAKDSPITHYFLGVAFPDTNYKLDITCYADDGTWFKPNVTNEAVDKFTFELEIDCARWEYSAVYSPLPVGL
jgi:hypothetical protein